MTARTVLVTGASGLIGRHVVAALQGHGLPVIAVSRGEAEISGANRVVRHDILDHQGRKAIADLEADILIHCAWDVKPGYWTSDNNERWRAASVDLVKRFRAGGGARAVLIGTCAEYDWGREATARPLSEREGPFLPATPYGSAKLAMRRSLELWSANTKGFSLASAILFFPFGGGEAVTRFAPSVIRGLLRNERVALTSCTQIRDIVDVKSVGEAVAALALSTVTGPVNIASGVGTSLKEFAQLAHSRIGGSGMLAFGAIDDRPNEPSWLVGDARRLQSEVCYMGIRGLIDGVDAAIDYWRAEIDRD